METITFECEVITPMFLAGADGKTPELRPPSIKGAMRFWWRAMNGHLVNTSLEDPYKPLRDAEAEIFGGSEGNGKKSSFSIIISQDKERYKLEKGDKCFLPHHQEGKNCSTCNEDNITKYCNKGKPRMSFTKGTFEVDILLKNSENKNIIKNLFILTTILGGFGKRSRRGFGSVKITKVDNQVFTLSNPLNDLVVLLNSINPSNFRINSEIIESNNSFQVNYPYLKTIQLGKTYSSSEELLKGIGQTTHDKNQRSKTHLGSANPRQSSPIYVSTILNDNNKLVPIITTLNTALENGNSLSTQQINEQNDFRSALTPSSCSP